jgi:hypothetical protein
MNPEAQAKLDELLALEPAALTEEDRAFLMARRSYLTEEQRKAYGLTEAPVAEEPVETEEAPKKSKK